MGKYEPLSNALNDYQGDAWDATFVEIEQELGFSLPPSARRHRAWWANQFKGNHSQAKAWIEAGWEVDPKEIDIEGETVRFIRSKSAGRRVNTTELDALRKKAMRFSGIDDQTELEVVALRYLVRYHAAQALIDLGGSDASAWVPARRRP